MREETSNILDSMKRIIRSQVQVTVEDGGIGPYDYGSQRGKDCWPYVYAMQNTYETNLELRYDEDLPKKFTVVVPYELRVNGSEEEHELIVAVKRMSYVRDTKAKLIKATWIWGE